MRYLYIGRDEVSDNHAAHEYLFSSHKLKEHLCQYLVDDNVAITGCTKSVHALGIRLKPGQQVRIPVSEIKKLMEKAEVVK